MWRWKKKRWKPGTRELLLDIIPKVELVPVEVPERIKVERVFEPEDKPRTQAAIAAKKQEKAKTTAGKKKAASGANPGELFKGEQYEVDIDKATSIINNKTHK